MNCFVARRVLVAGLFAVDIVTKKVEQSSAGGGASSNGLPYSWRLLMISLGHHGLLSANVQRGVL